MLLQLRKPIVFNFFLLRKLPLAFVAGLRLVHLDDEQAVTTVPFRWMTRNPFRSMYFAVLAIAAEFSTGVLAALILEQSKKNVAMLIVHIDARFIQRAQSKVTFRCADGETLKQGIEQCLQSGEGVEVTTRATGTLKDGTVVAEFDFTWSFKKRKQGSV